MCEELVSGEKVNSSGQVRYVVTVALHRRCVDELARRNYGYDEF